MTRNKNGPEAEQFSQQIITLFEDDFLVLQKYLLFCSLRKGANPIESYDLERSQSFKGAKPKKLRYFLRCWKESV